MAALTESTRAQDGQGRRVARGALLAFAGALILVLATGCGKSKGQGGGNDPVEVEVATPTVKTVTDYEDFIGRMEGSGWVELRSRATGYLSKAPFLEGTDVKKGDLVGEIDARSSRAELARAEANLVQAQAELVRSRANLLQSEARVRRLSKDLGRATALGPRGAMSREELDKVSGDYAEADASVGSAKGAVGAAEAAVGSAEASVEVARVNLSHTRISAPFSGRISRRWIDPGNLVKADDTVLTTIVAVDPIYAYFDIDERTLLRLRKLYHNGEYKSLRETKQLLDVGLADEEGFSLKGHMDFADNRLDASTGTLRIRVVVPNPKQLLSPGLFARMRLPVSPPHTAILVSEGALGTDQGQKFLHLLDKEDKVVYRQVKVGPLHGDLRVVTQGLSPTDRVIVKGHQRVKVGNKVHIKPKGEAPPPNGPSPTKGPG